MERRTRIKPSQVVRVTRDGRRMPVPGARFERSPRIAILRVWRTVVTLSSIESVRGTLGHQFEIDVDVPAVDVAQQTPVGVDCV